MNVRVDDSSFYFFSREEMLTLADRHKVQFATAAPFPHVTIDDFLPPSVALRIAKAFPGVNDIDWKLEGPGDSKHSGDRRIEKIATSDEEKFPDFIRFMMMQLQSGIFMTFLERLTGFEHLQPDPHHYGCGLHSTGRGGRLMVHLDASRHPNKDLNQLINCIYYCTPDWDPAYGGGLELWNADASQRVVTVEPRFNRLAVFNVSGKSWHGHPHPVECPPEIRRNSMALYYYTTDKAATGYEYSNFVRWKSVTEHDKKAPLHVVKSVLRSTLPQPALNALANFARKTGLNMKGRAPK
jgi:hypothetical protein